MRITTPITIWRFLLGQLLYLLLLTCLIMVAVLAFVGAVRLLANGTLGALETLMLAGWLTVPMMQYALPFAGGFAATLAYHRMSQDNELTACYAGGVSHRALLAPALGVALVLGGAMFVLADQVMPRFLRAAQEMITSDPSRLLASRLGKGQSLEFDGGRKLLYADEVAEVPVQPGELAFKRMVLKGVIALEFDDKGNILREVSSPVANVWLFRGGSSVVDPRAIKSPAERWGSPGAESTTAVMRLKDPVGGRTNVAIGTVNETVVAYRLPSTFRDRAKFLPWSDLNHAWHNPQRITAVDDVRRALAHDLAERTVVDGLRSELARVGRVTLIDPAGRPVSLRASGIAAPTDAGFGLVPSATGGTIDVTVVGAPSADGTPRTQTHRAARGTIGQAAASDSGTALALTLEEVKTSGEGANPDEPAGVLTTLTIGGLRPSLDPLSGYLSLPIGDLLERAEQRNPAATDAPLARSARRLAEQVGETRREIRSKQHERVAVSLSCVGMVLLGAVMGMRLGSAPPLTVYLWSFLPALAGEVAVSGGQTMAEQTGTPGLLLMYGGVLAVSLLTLRNYLLLARH